MDTRGLSKTLTFHQDNSQAKWFVSFTRAVYAAQGVGIRVARVDGEMTATQRQASLQELGPP